jgi:hypothetical protein
MLGHKNVHFLCEQPEQPEQHKAEPSEEHRKIIKAEGEFKKVSLDPRVPDKTVCIGVEVSQE